MNIFPHTLIRFGGDTFESWAKLESDELYQQLQAIYKLDKSKFLKKEKLCDELFEYIESLNDTGQQNLLQNIRRDIYNSRKIKNSKVNKALEILPDQLKTSLEEYLSLVEEIKEKLNNGEALYQDELVKMRNQLKDISNQETIRKGLLLSSKSLLERLNSYIQRDPANFRKKEVQVEQGLLKYLTRMYAKTSPFSTFTNLAIGKIGKSEDAVISSTHEQGSNEVKGHIRLNNQLFKYLFDLLKNYKPAYLEFKLRPNPTLINEGKNFLYLTNNNNIESFQRIPFNPVVEFILEVVNHHPTGITYKELISTLLDNIDADEAELEDYVMQLITYGCLEYNLGVSGIDPDWDLKLVESLQPLVEAKVEHIPELVNALHVTRKLGEKYGSAEADERKSILKEAYESIKSICMKIHETAGLPEDERKDPQELQAERRKKQEEEKAKKENDQTDNSEKSEQKEENKEEEETIFKHETSTYFYFKPEQMFYEDTTREAITTIDDQALKKFVSKLDRLLQSFSFMKGMQDERDTMNHYFSHKYGSDKSVDLLKFYEDYFRDYKRPKNELTEKKKQETTLKNQLNAAKKSDEKEPEKEKLKELEEHLNKLGNEINELESSLPFDEPDSIKKRSELIDQWNIKFNELFQYDKNQDQINIRITDIEKTNDQLDVQISESHNTSYGSFVQFYNDKNGSLSAVLNSSFSGFGKMLSRFLHILDPEVTSDLRTWNINTNHDDSMLIEDCDASYFNANLHPPLMPHEIWMPGGHNTLDESAQIPITDFEIAHDASEDKLWLKHKPSGKNAHVFDLGFQGHMGRSQLFQLLDKFSKAEYLSAGGLISAINYPKTAEDKAIALDKVPKETKETPLPEPQISLQPRIVYEDTIVLQRKSWNVPKSLIPERLPMDSDWIYYNKVNQWRLKHGMPDEVFVFINPNRWNTTLDPKLTQKLTRDDYKPQYIDFRNPLLIMLLERLITKVPQILKIQEMLPNSEQMVKIDDKRYVSEFVVQWYK